MSTLEQYRFRIDAFSIDSLPMSRLAEYMSGLAKLLGEPERVHFSHIENGSAVLVSTVEYQAAPKVSERLRDVRNGTGPKDALQAFRELDAMLAKDNAVGQLVSPTGAEIIPFPGRTRPKPVRYGPFREHGSLDGIVIRVGGTGDTIPVHLLNADRLLTCHTTVEVSKRLATHYRAAPVRVYGEGKWIREENGAWTLQEFGIEDFEVLDDSSLLDIVSKLRAVEGSRWGDDADPMKSILELRDRKDLH
jgi:hypothetical protein